MVKYELNLDMDYNMLFACIVQIISPQLYNWPHSWVIILLFHPHSGSCSQTMPDKNTCHLHKDNVCFTCQMFASTYKNYVIIIYPILNKKWIYAYDSKMFWIFV